MKYPEQNLGEKIKTLRKMKGWSQYELAEKLDCSQKVITHYERNYRKPSVDKLPLIAKVLGVSLDELFGIKSLKQKFDQQNPRLRKKVDLIEKLPLSEKRTILKMIDTLTKARNIT